MDGHELRDLLGDIDALDRMPAQPGFDAMRERGVETVFAVANGVLGVRGALDEGGAASHPLLIVAGVFVPTASEAQQTLLAVADPAIVEIQIDGTRLDMRSVETADQRRVLDLDRALARRAWRFTDAHGRAWSLKSVRVASIAGARPYLHALSLRLDRGVAADVAVRVAVGSGERDVHGEVARWREVRTYEGASLAIARSAVAPGWAATDNGFTCRLDEGAELRIETMTTVHSPANRRADDAGVGLDGALAAHLALATERRRTTRISAEGRPDVEAAVELAVYHLLAASAPLGGATSIGARDLSGEGYHGHIFWDTDVFAVPALTFLDPASARSCLEYRHRTLPEARLRARAHGYRGALFAWESTDTGADRTPAAATLPDGSRIEIETGELEHHIVADVAYAVMRYWEATGDDEFMREHGAEIVFECARFWASRVSPAGGDRLAIRDVIGPDEFHPRVSNNAFTNAMAAYSLRAAAEAAAWLAASDAPAATAVPAVDPPADEVDAWRRTAAMVVRASFLDDEVVEQFDGFFGLTPVDVAAYREAGVPIDIALGPHAVAKLRVIKQADVIMAAALLPDAWSERAVRANFGYYAPLTSHVSSLSAPVYAQVAAWLRDEVSLEHALRRVIDTDFGNGHLGAGAGIHVATCGGLWQVVVFGLAGFRYSASGVAFDPYLPGGMHRLSFALRWRGRILRVSIVAGALDITIEGGPARVRVNGVEREVADAEPARFAWDPRHTRWSGMEASP